MRASQNVPVDKEDLLQITQSKPEDLTQGLLNQLVYFDESTPEFKDGMWVEMIGECEGVLVGGIRQFKDNGELWIVHVYFDTEQNCWRLNHEKTSSGAFQLLGGG